MVAPRASAGIGRASPTCRHRRISDLAAVEFEADLLAWQESEEGQQWQAMVAEELAEDGAAAEANERALREAPQTGFATLAEAEADRENLRELVGTRECRRTPTDEWCVLAVN